MKDYLEHSWPTPEVINKLCEAADILLHNCNYDGHGYEEIALCSKLGKERVKEYYIEKEMKNYAKCVKRLSGKEIAKRVAKFKERFGE